MYFFSLYIYICVWGGVYIYIYIYIVKSKVVDCNQGRPEGSLFNSYDTEV